MNISRDRGHLIILLAAVAAVVWVFYFGYGPGSQMERLRLASRHVAKIGPLIGADSKFSQIRCGGYTGGGGMLGVYGFVASQTDMERLQKLIEASRPPVKTYWQVNIVGEEAFQRLFEQRNARAGTVPSLAPP